ncbi:HAD domain-containing protein [Actinomycetospora lemnae]|uniref:HAD domain-containing protein n=1 Tax=Actinomycetospora lemnae TaxID=3019891 RepID=A0ABT5SUM9_9PSEU|nr:HAD domain-containing protein [Actinomycetospora sp. DW7H6]MDD7966565.1 HAD domain-containing protein [Actinomycetospora sp. DW7H6]
MIAIDVDGVLNPDNMSNSRAERLGYQLSKRLRAHRMMRTFWNREHGTQLLRLADDHNAELVWATYWGEMANDYARWEVGLPELPVIDLDHATLTTVWKYPSILAFAEGRPLVWFDDEHVIHPRSGDEFLRTRAEPTKLIEVSPVEGLREVDFQAARTFLETLDPD